MNIPIRTYHVTANSLSYSEIGTLLQQTYLFSQVPFLKMILRQIYMINKTLAGRKTNLEALQITPEWITGHKRSLKPFIFPHLDIASVSIAGSLITTLFKGVQSDQLLTEFTEIAWYVTLSDLWFYFAIWYHLLENSDYPQPGCWSVDNSCIIGHCFHYQVQYHLSTGKHPKSLRNFPQLCFDTKWKEIDPTRHAKTEH